MKNLNGWERLWILVSALWLIIVGVIAVRSIPTAEDWRDRYRAYARDDARRLQEEASDLERACSAYIRGVPIPDGACSDETLRPLRELPARKQAAVVRQEEIAEQVINNDLLPHQAKLAGSFLALALVPIALMYGAGLAVAWVIRGFKVKS